MIVEVHRKVRVRIGSRNLSRCQWEIIKRYSVNPHPSYQIGFGRTSCLFCIFGNSNQWASAKAISPVAFEKVAGYEAEFGKTIKRSESVRQQADKGVAYEKKAQNSFIKVITFTGSRKPPLLGGPFKNEMGHERTLDILSGGRHRSRNLA
jgi:hypothetical protein